MPDAIPLLATTKVVSHRGRQHKKGHPESSTRKALDEILDNPDLPSPPSVALQIVELASDVNADFKDIVRVLKVDPAICAKLLKTVNSCIYGLRQPVVAVERAVAIVGIHPLRSLVLGLAIPSLQGGESDAGLRSFWRESLSGAMMARELAARARDPQAEEVFLAGLLRDLGATLLRKCFGSAYDPVWKGSQPLLGEKQCIWERDQFGVDHAELSAGLLTRWHLPKEVVEPVRCHHAPDQINASESRLRKRARLLDFCSRLARVETLSEDAEALQEAIRLAESEYGMSIADLEKFLDEVCPKIEAFAEILDIGIGSVTNYARVMAAGCAELARLSVELSLGTPPEEGSQADTHALRPYARHETNFSLGDAARSDGYSLDFLDHLHEPGFRHSIQQYRVEEVLGRGGMGVVLKAFEPALERTVALKMISPQLAGHPRIRDRFTQEARAAASILHENVVTVFTVGKYRGVSFLVMEYVDGLSIQDHFKYRRRFRPVEIVRIGRECAQGLVAAHRLGIIHRDIKPGNILLRRQGERAQLTDFGLACVVREEAHLDLDEPILGTPEYMSPEQSEGDPVTTATDLYSLGGAMYAMCTCTHPIPWINRRDTSGRSLTAAIRRANAEVPDELIHLVVKLMATEASSRFSSAEETAEALAEVGRRM